MQYKMNSGGKRFFLCAAYMLIALPAFSITKDYKENAVSNPGYSRVPKPHADTWLKQNLKPKEPEVAQEPQVTLQKKVSSRAVSETPEQNTLLVNPGDANNNGRVDNADIGLVAGLWGATADDDRFLQAADLYADGVIDGNDIAVILANWGETYTPVDVTQAAPATVATVPGRRMLSIDTDSSLLNDAGSEDRRSTGNTSRSTADTPRSPFHAAPEDPDGHAVTITHPAKTAEMPHAQGSPIPEGSTPLTYDALSAILLSLDQRLQEQWAQGDAGDPAIGYEGIVQFINYIASSDLLRDDQSGAGYAEFKSAVLAFEKKKAAIFSSYATARNQFYSSVIEILADKRSLLVDLNIISADLSEKDIERIPRTDLDKLLARLDAVERPDKEGAALQQRIGSLRETSIDRAKQVLAQEMSAAMDMLAEGLNKDMR